jgi:hypothetical protein
MVSLLFNLIFVSSITEMLKATNGVEIKQKKKNIVMACEKIMFATKNVLLIE